MNVKKILPIWWAWQWRVLVAVLLANIALGFVVGLAGGILGVAKENLIIITNLVSYGVTIYASIYFLAYVFKKFGIYAPSKESDPYRTAAVK